MNKNKIVLIIILIFILALNGCWDRREPEDYAMVISLGFDYNPERELYKIILQIVSPLTTQGVQHNGGGEGTPEFWTVSAWGHTTIDALANVRKKVSRQIHYSHTHLFVLSETLLKTKGILPVIDGIERTRESRRIVRFAVVKEDVEELLSVRFAIETINAKALRDQINLTNDEIGGTIEETARVFINKLSRPGIEPVAVLLELLKEQKEDNNQGENNNNLKPSQGPPVKLAGLAAFNKDKLVGFLNDRETRGYNWIKGKIKRAVLTMESPEKNTEFLTIVASQSLATIEPIMENNQPRIKLTIRAIGKIQAIMGSASFKEKSDLTNSLKQSFAQVIENDIEIALAQAQSLKSDIFGFGDSFYRLKYQNWLEMEDDWPEIFADLAVEIDVQVELKHTGLINRSVTPR